MQTNTRVGILTRPPFVIIGLFVLALSQSVEQLGRALIGRNDLWSDAANVWLPLAEHVASGNALYVGAAVDNKPPFWQYLNLAVFETGHYVAVFYLLVGLANALAAWLLYRWVSGFARRETAAVAALLFVAALPLLNGTIINVRSFALVFLLMAVQIRRASVQGALIAVAGLFSQYAVFGIPALLWYRHTIGRLNARQFVAFCGAGLLTVVVSFLPLLWWGVPSVVGGVEWSFFAAESHLLENDVLNPWLAPMDWAAKLAQVAEQMLYLLVPAALYTVRVMTGRVQERSAIDIVLVGFVALYALSFGVKSLRYYWLLLLPFLAALAALEVEAIYRQVAG